jgi:hypothetical protein
MTIGVRPNVCAACGYPVIGHNVCYFCRPLVAAAVVPFPRTMAASTDTGQQASVVPAAAGPSREPLAAAG